MLVAPSFHTRYSALGTVCITGSGSKGSIMRFSDIIEQAKALLQRQGRVTYRTLKREFDLDDTALEDLKFELIEGQELAVDKEGKMLVWTGTPSEQRAASGAQPQAEEPAPPRPIPAALSVEAERRQLTV